MNVVEEKISSALNQPVREIGAQVVIWAEDGLGLRGLFRNTDKLKSFTIERIGENNKFFGFGICQKINVKLIDKNREINNISAGDIISPAFRVDGWLGYSSLPTDFIITEINRDEVTNELSITAYDRLYFAADHKIDEIFYKYNFSYEILALDIATILFGGSPDDEEPITSVIFDNISSEEYRYEIGNSANIEGTETMRDILNAIAEATQSIYYISSGQLYFKRLEIEGEPVFTIDKDKYFTLHSGDNKRLAKVVSATELGDNISAELTVSGSTQYVRNNPFWENNADIINIVDDALANIGGLTINQFKCKWRGNYLVSLCEKIALVTKDNETVTSYLINDTINYNGGLIQESYWQYEESEAEAADNPTSIGEAIKYTYAKVDKINKEIEIVASETQGNTSKIAEMQIDTNTIKSKVEATEKEIESVTKKVETTITAEDMTIAIQKELENGVNSVTTATGFTFDADGLKVTKSGSEISTQITEDGMRVTNDNTEVLSANNQGVTAIDLHATTFLIIGENSRLEDYEGRTGCFWIGGRG